MEMPAACIFKHAGVACEYSRWLSATGYIVYFLRILRVQAVKGH